MCRKGPPREPQSVRATINTSNARMVAQTVAFYVTLIEQYVNAYTITSAITRIVAQRYFSSAVELCVLCVLTYHYVHGTAPAYLSDSLQLTSEIVARRCLRSADTTTLEVPPTCRATLGDCAFPVAAACAWNSLPLATGSLLTFDIPEGDQVSPFSSVIRLTCRRLLRWSADVCIELCNSYRSRFL